MPEMQAVAKRLKEYRAAQKKTQFEMGAEMGLSTEEISLIKRKRRDDMKLTTMQKIAAHMGITVSELLRIEEQEAEERDNG